MPLRSEDYLQNLGDLQALFQNAPDAIMVERFDPPYPEKSDTAAHAPPRFEDVAEVVYANPAFIELLNQRGLNVSPGLSGPELQGQIETRMAESFKEIWANRLKQIIHNTRLSSHYAKSKGRDDPLMLSTTPITQDGYVVGCWTRITDATPAMAYDAAERRALKQIDAFVRTENVPLMCLEFATPLPATVPAQDLGVAYYSATVTHITDSAAELFGGTPASMLQRTVAELNKPQIKALLQNAFPGGPNSEPLNLGDTASLLVEVQTAEHHVYNVKPTFVFDNDQAVEAWIRIEDVTTEELERRRQQTIEKTRALAMAAASLHQFETHWESGTLKVDPKIIEELNLMPLPDTKEDWIELLAKENMNIPAQDLANIFDCKSKELSFIARMPNKDGGESFIEVWALFNPNDLPLDQATTVGLFRDVTESQKLYERLSEKKTLEGLGVLAGGVAHDFNNLLMSVLGYAELMEADLIDAAGRNSAQLQQNALQNISEIRTAALRASELCASLLAYAGQHLIEKKTIDLTELVRSTAELVEVTIGKRVPLLLELDKEIRISADRGQLTRVIINLIGNAADAMEGYSGAIHLSTTTTVLTPEEQVLLGDQLEAPHERVACIIVSDNGCGMAPDIQKRIYEPFFTTKNEGQGLGMAAVHGIVKHHGGAILLQSAEGEGTEFRICLPLLARVPTSEHPVPFQEQTEQQAQQEQQEQTKAVDRPQVLVVDDEAGVRTIAAEMLRHLNCDVVEAENATEALALFSSYKFDYALLDITMPVMSGDELAELLLERVPDLKVVLCSGYTDKSVPEGLLARCAFIHKPFTLKEVSDTLELESVLGDRAVPV